MSEAAAVVAPCLRSWSCRRCPCPCPCPSPPPPLLTLPSGASQAVRKAYVTTCPTVSTLPLRSCQHPLPHWRWYNTYVTTSPPADSEYPTPAQLPASAASLALVGSLRWEETPSTSQLGPITIIACLLILLRVCRIVACVSMASSPLSPSNPPQPSKRRKIVGHIASPSKKAKKVVLFVVGHTPYKVTLSLTPQYEYSLGEVNEAVDCQLPYPGKGQFTMIKSSPKVLVCVFQYDETTGCSKPGNTHYQLYTESART